MRKLILSAVIGWLLWLGFLILIVRVNKYDWADLPMLDCDTDAQAAVTLFVWLVWITAAAFLAWFYLTKVPFRANFESFTLSIVLLISIGSAFNYIALLKYDETISLQCGVESSDSQLNGIAYRRADWQRVSAREKICQPTLLVTSR